MKVKSEKTNELSAETLSHIMQLLAQDNEGLEHRLRLARHRVSAVRSLALVCMMAGCVLVTSIGMTPPKNCTKVVCVNKVDTDQVCEQINNIIFAL